MKMSRALVVLAVATLSLPTAARAQSQSATDIVGFLMLNQAVPTADFERDRAAADAARQTIVNALLVNPRPCRPTSSGGFVYRINELLGTAERAGDTFGPFFVERALTPGKGHPSFGVSAATTSFSELDGKNLRDGSLLTISNQFRDEAAPFDTENLTLKIRTSGMTLFGSVPVTDHFEIGAALPLVRLELDGARVTVHRGTHSLRPAPRRPQAAPAILALPRQSACSTKKGSGLRGGGAQGPDGRSGQPARCRQGWLSCLRSGVLRTFALCRPPEPWEVAGGGVSNEVSLSAAGLVRRQSPRDAFR
jgi:hypothetical protein